MVKKDWSGSKLYSLANRRYRDNQKRVLSLLEKGHNAKVLDIGCGDGGFTVEIGSVIGTEELYGLDIDANRVKKARERGIKAIVHDANTRLPYEDDCFDVVVTNQLLEHLNDTDGFFREVRRVLKPGGYAVISTVNLSSFHNLFFMVFGMMPSGLHVSEIHVGNCFHGMETHGYAKLFTITALKDLARYHGFRVEKLVGNGIYLLPSPIESLLSRLLARYAIYLTIKIRRPEAPVHPEVAPTY
jgi:ubiquinone/menaquinone biosynthesis C-methylase UbiE